MYALKFFFGAVQPLFLGKKFNEKKTFRKAEKNIEKT